MGRKPVIAASSGRSGERIAKVIARNGACSRRTAEKWILEGRVSLNGREVKTPNLNVGDNDKIAIDGKVLEAKKGTRLWLYHKPAGKVVTESDPEGRPTIFEDLAERGLPRVLSVGRLDINTEGLLLLTNDGGLKRVLELPETGWLRRYRVRAHGRISPQQLEKLHEGMRVDGVKYGPMEASLEREKGGNVWLNLGLREGKNREVKIVLGALGLQVNRLIRVSYGPFQLGDLKPGAVSTVKTKMLADQLGRKLAEKANVDFASEMPAGLPPEPAQPKRMMPKDITKPRQRRARHDYDDDQMEQDQPRKRRVLFSDGRQPEYFEPSESKDKKKFAKGDRREKPQGDRADKKSFNDRGPRSDRPRSDRPRSDSPRSDSPRSDRPGSDRPGSDRSRSDGPRNDRPRSDRPRSDRTSGDRSQGRGGYRGDKPREERSFRSDGPKRDGPKRDGPKRDGPRRDGPNRGGPRSGEPKRDGPRRDGPRHDGPRRDGPRRDGPNRGGRPGDDRGPRRFKSERAERSDRPRSERPSSEGPRGDRPPRRSDGRRPTGGRPPRGRPTGR